MSIDDALELMVNSETYSADILEAKQAIYTDLMELIGTDHITVMGFPETTKHLDSYRQELRERVKKYCE